MKKLILFMVVFLITGMALNVYGQITTLWERNARTTSLPSWWTDVANAWERGIAYGYTNNGSGVFNHRVFVASRTGGTFVRILNADDGTDVGTLSTTGITGGTYLINDIDVSADGKIFAGNLDAGSGSFKIYKWDHEGSTPVAVYTKLAYTYRLGDKITVVGSTADNSIKIYAPSATTASSKILVLSTTDNGATFTASEISLTPTVGTATSFTPIAGSSNFFMNHHTISPKEISGDGTTTIGTIPTAVIEANSNSIRYFTIGEHKFLAAFTFKYSATTSNYAKAVIALLDNGTNLASKYIETPNQGINNNTNGAGDIAIRDNGNNTYTLYVLGSNNGLGAYTISLPTPGTTDFTALWEKCSVQLSMPSWFGANTERGIAYGNVGGNDRIYVPSRSSGNVVRIINSTNGSDVGTLNVTGITGGTLAINDAEISSDGKIFVCNVTTNASSDPFKVYKWDTEGGSPTAVISYNSAAYRLGDNFTVVGSTSDNSIVIYAPVASAGKVIKFTTTDNGTTFTPTEITLAGFSGTPSSPSVAPVGPGESDFYYTGTGQYLKKYSSTGALLSTIPELLDATETVVKFINSINGYDYIATFEYGGSGKERGRVIQIPSGNLANSSIFGSTRSLYLTANGNGTGDLGIKNNGDGTYSLFVLGTNNGIGAYTVNLKNISWANLQFPQTANILIAGSANVYAQVYESGITEASGQGAGIQVWIGYSTSNTHPSTWSDWVAASYNGDQGNNDEYLASIGSSLSAGKYFYASRIKLNNGPYIYGGYNAGFWDGTTNVSGVLWITGNTIDGNLNETNYTQLATKQNSNSGFGSAIDISKIVYSIDQTSNLLYLGFYGKIPVGNTNGIGLWLDFSELTGVSSGVALGNNPGVSHYLGNTGHNNYKADFEVDYMFGLNSGSSSNCYVDIVKLVGGSTGSYLGNASINGTAVMGPSASGVLSKYGSLFSFNNSVGEKTGFEIVIPFSELGVTATGTISAFGMVVSSDGYFSDVTVPGNIVTEANPGYNADFSTLSGSPFHSGPSLLPVELSSFNYFLKGNAVNLKWSTKTEVNSYQFVIERSLSSHSSSLSSHLLWEAVGDVNASGNSNSPKEYSFTDKNLAQGKYSYRLKMIDNDGTFEYSQVVEVEVDVPNTFALSQNYPNPFNPNTVISYQLPVNSQVKLVIYSITGEMVATLVDENQVAGSYTVPFNASALASGTYIYRLVAGDFVSTKKMVVLK